MKYIKFYSYGLLFAGLLAFGYYNYVSNLRKKAQIDLDFIHQTILQNHPGPHNHEDPDFIPSMNKAYGKAKEDIQSITSKEAQKEIYNTYLNSFHDSHVRFFTQKNKTKTHENQPIAHSFLITERAEKTIWVTLPTCMPNKSQQAELKHIISQIPKYRDYKTIVFDVRNNTGGNSAWGTNIIEALFGKEYTQQQIRNMNKNIQVDWRASKDNAEYLVSLKEDIKEQFGKDSSMFLEFEAIAQGVQNSLQEDKLFYTEYATQPSATDFAYTNPVRATIIIITSALCVSACLDFIDEMKAVNPQTILIGTTTNADSCYIDVRFLELPSCIGKFQFPIKVYRNRPRGHNVPYVPDIMYPKTVTTEADKEAWLQTTINSIAVNS